MGQSPKRYRSGIDFGLGVNARIGAETKMGARNRERLIASEGNAATRADRKAHGGIPSIQRTRRGFICC